MVRFFTAAVVVALGAMTATAGAAPKHHGYTKHHSYAKSKSAKGKKAKDNDKSKDKSKDATDATDTAGDQTKSDEHDVKEPGTDKASSRKASKDKTTEGIPKVVETKKTGKGKEAIKTYKFGAQEVEGRLKSPQIIYFLRRVRAEFEAGDLGHRSFMRELSDTRRDPAFR